jgi:O-antigen/teichoic acid export membrane protein
VVMLAYVFYAVYLNSLIGIYLKKKTKYLPPITIAGMVGNVAANYVLIPPLGIMGAAWARFIAYFIMAIALYLVGQRLYPVQYEWKRLYKLVLVVGFLFFLSRINVVSSHFGLEMGVLAAFPIILYLIGFFEKNEINKMFEICFPKRLIKR